jgi:hypothetical protein
MTRLHTESARVELAFDYLKRSLDAPPDVAAELRGRHKAFLASSRLAGRGPDIIVALASRHAANPRFQKLCDKLCECSGASA